MSQKAVEIKQLSPRLAGEWFGIPNITVSWHVAKKYAQFGTVRPSRHVAKKYAQFGTVRSAVGAVLGEGRQKSIVRSCECFLSRLWSFNIDTY